MTPRRTGVATVDGAHRQNAAPAPSSADTPTAWRMIAWVTGAVIVASVGAQLLFVDMTRPVSWDEAVYLSQVRPDVDALPFAAQRARGLPWLIAPAALMSPGIDAIRVYVAALTGAGLFAAFLPWIHTVAWGTPIAAAGYGFTWFVLVSHSEVYPNALTAVAALGAVGWFLRLVVHRAGTAATGDSRAAVGLAAAVAVLALIRPTEAVLLCAALVVVLAGLPRRVVTRAIVAMLGGGLIGTAPWIAEAFIRFGGVLSRVRDMVRMTTEAEPPAPVWRQYLSMLDGPIQGPVDAPEIGMLPALWVVALAAFCALGWVAAVRAGRTRLAVALTAAAVALGGPYLVANPLTYLRFLLPTYAVACGLAGVGAAVFVRGALRRRAVGVAAIVVVGVLGSGWLVWQLRVAAAVSDDLTQSRLGTERLAELLLERVDGGSCAFSSEFGWPQIAYASGCDGERLIPDDAAVPFAETDEYDHVFALLRSSPPSGSVLETWSAEPVTVPAVEGWTLYTRPQES